LESCSFVIGKLSRERITRGGDRSTRMCECGDALARPAQAKSVWNIELSGSSGSSARQAWLDRSLQRRRGRGTCSKLTTSHRCDRSQPSERRQRLGRRSALVVRDGLRARSPRRRRAWLQFWWMKLLYTVTPLRERVLTISAAAQQLCSAPSRLDPANM
jgi:hypothetical protein